MKERPLISDLVKDTKIPKFFKVKQIFQRPVIKTKEIPNHINKILSDEKFSSKIKPGMHIAITAGSRGIANVALITKCIVDFVRSKNASPFVVPAMGSHGGATDEGQKNVLAGYGITEEYIGCPILSSMDVVKIGVNEEGTDVFIDKNAASADGIIISCRIKPHDGFRGPYESGIMKMMTIGLGKQYGAQTCHEQGFENMAKNVPLFGRAILKNAKILFAIPVIENAFDETCKIVGVLPENVVEEEPILLKEAFNNMPRIRVKKSDVLIVDQIGKNFSGSGLDPNITGTFSTKGMTGNFKAQRVCALDLSKESHGNGMGIGFVNAITKRIFDKLDLQAMYPNAITCAVLEDVRIPLIMESDKDTIKVCIQTCNLIDKENPKIVRIPNSLHIEHIMLSESYYEEARADKNLIIESEPEYLNFDDNDNLL